MEKVQESLDSSLDYIEDSRKKYGFETLIEQKVAPFGLSEDVIRLISQENREDEYVYGIRMKALRYFQSLKNHHPDWANIKYDPIDVNKMSFFAYLNKDNEGNISQEDEDILRDTYEKLGISTSEQDYLLGKSKDPVAIDFVFDSVSVKTTFQKTLKDLGIIFCSISEAFKKYPDIIRSYFGTVVPMYDNYYAALNTAVFSDGTFVYVPPGIKCPMELATYFRINAKNVGQFERTLIVADKDSYVSYLEGCTAPIRNENQLHCAVVEIVLLENAEVRYSTVQNWWPGTKKGVGGIYNFVTKRADCKGDYSKVSWNQVEIGSSITWKYPSCILRGKYSRGIFNSVAVTRGYQQADTGTKMIHLGSNTTSSIIAKAISLDNSSSTYRSIVSSSPQAENVVNYTQCDSLVMGDSQSCTYPTIKSGNSSTHVCHEASTSKINEEYLFYCMQKGLSFDESISLIVNGFFRGIIQELPMEFAVEAKKLIEITLEGSVG